MTDQYLPDTFAGMTGAFNAGRLIRAQNEQAQQKSQLRSLAPGVLAGDPNATAQAYALDPATAKAYGEGADRMGLQLHNIANQLKQFHAQGNEQAAAMLYQQAAPMIRQKFPNAPAQWDPNALMPAIDAVVAMTAPTDPNANNVHSAFPGQNGNMWVLGRDGQAHDTGVPFDPKMQVFDTNNGVVGINRTSGTFAPITPAGQGAPRAPGEVPFNIDPSLPPEVQAQIRADPNAGSAQGITSLPQAAPPIGPPGGQLRSAPSIADQAREAELQAKQTRNLSPEEVASRGYRPGTIVQVDGFGNEQVTQAPPSEAAGGRLSATALRQVNAAKAKLIDLQSVKNQLALVQQKFAPLQNSFAAGPFGGGLLPTEDGKRYDAAVSLLQQFVRKLTRTPGEGSMSDWEGKLAMLANPSRNDYESVTQDKIDQLNSLVDQIEGGYKALLQDNQGEAAPPGAPAQPAAPASQGGWSVKRVN